MSSRAAGNFDVQLSPLQGGKSAEDAALVRMSIDKQFHGDLEGTSRGEMLTSGAFVKGSAGYVAIEHVSGTLHRRDGTFALMHTGIMNRGAPQLTIMVVPDSGTGELTGLSGTFTIDVGDGNHSYEFDYTITDIP